MKRVGIRAILFQLLALLATLAACVLALPVVSVAEPTVLYTFTAPAFPQVLPATNSDGIAPASRLVLARDGYLYGTTLHGGVNGAGSIFRASVTGILSNLYSFLVATNNSGEVVYDLGPNDLAQGTNGNLYGTTRRSGSNFTGTIFMISPSGSFANLHTFAAEITNSSGRVTSTDGETPTGALVEGGDGNFYGTTQYGGANGTGTIFQITPGGAFTSLYSFAKSVASSATTNGTVPNALVLGSNSVFYGTTEQGGIDNAGTLFAFSKSGGFAQIYSFNGEAPGNSPITPNSALVQGANGNFCGTSAFGGSQGGGCIFEITAAGDPTVLHSFPLLDAGAGAALTLDVDGNFYGTTAADGLNGDGTLFRMTPAGNFSAYSFSTLDMNSENAGGASPSAALTGDGAGNLYGTCAAGGTNGSGVIFQVFGPNFIPPFFISVSNPPPALTNMLVGASVTLSNYAQGLAPLTYQWLRNGTNLTDVGDILGSATNRIIINPVFPRDIGRYTLVISNVWGALTSSVTVVTVASPGVSISSPAPNASTGNPVFAGTATNAPLFPNTNPSEILLTNIFFAISNLLTGSNITGLAQVSGSASGASNWSFTATPYPGTNVLSVQSVDASGNKSPVVSVAFFYVVTTPLTVLTIGSGTGSFSIANGALINLGENYSITARPVSSTFDNWSGSGIISFDPTLQFIMQSNLVLKADFTARQPPAISIAFPTANARTSLSVYEETAKSSPLLAGVNPNNVRLTNVVYWLTNAATGSVLTGTAALTQGTSVSNWTVTLTPSPGTNTLAVQTEDASGDVSPVVSRTFFYEVPAPLTVAASGSGVGTFTITNGTLLNLGEGYTITARPGAFSTFGKWVSSSGAKSSRPALSFMMQSNLVLTVTFATNFFHAAAGTYNGLFYPADGVSEESSGMLYNLVLRGTGAFTGQLLTTGTNYKIATSFDSVGHAAFSAGPLQVALTLDNATHQITGTISDSQFTADLTAKLASSILPPAEYTLLFSPSTNVSAVSPPGDGYSLVTNHAGVVSLTGALADGTSYNQTVSVSQNGDLPIYASLYSKTSATSPGLLLGWINLTNLQNAAPVNALTWIKNPGRGPALYTNGFTNILSVQGALWTNPPPATPAISMTNGQLVISNGSLLLTYTNIVVRNDNSLTNPGVQPTNSLTGSINPNTGQLVVAFANGNGGTTTNYGTVLQTTTNGGGYFLTTSNAGVIHLQP